jgi:mycothiol synthase
VRPAELLTWRPLHVDDAELWAGLMAAVESVDGFGEHYTSADLADELDSPTSDPTHDAVAVLDGDRMVAFGIVTTPRAPSGGAFSIGLWGGVRPSHRGRGIGRDLLARMEARAATVHRERLGGAPSRLVAHALDVNADRRRLLERAGYEVQRWFFDMERDLAERVEEPSVPPDLTLVGFDPVHDDAVRRAHNEAFAAHWGSSERSSDEWGRWFTGERHFRPDLSFVVLDRDEVAAYALCHRYPEEDGPQGYTSGWLGQLGTRRPWRGRGLGTALLRRIIVAMQDDGLDRAALDVDTANASGALALYEREGFATRTRRAAYTKALAPREAPSAPGSH